MDWLAEICEGMEEAEKEDNKKIAKIDAKIANRQAKIAELKAQRDDWKSRTYKSNTAIHINREEEQTISYGEINNRRRIRKIRFLTEQIEKIEQEISDLEYSKSNVVWM